MMMQMGGVILDGRRAAMALMFVAGAVGVPVSAGRALAQGASADWRDSTRAARASQRMQARRDSVAQHLALRVQADSLVAQLQTLQRKLEREGLEGGDRARLVSEVTALVSQLALLEGQRAGTRLRLGLTPEAIGELARAADAMEAGAAAMVLAPRAPDGALPRGWIGINVEAPHVPWVRGDSMYIRYFTYPQIVSIEPNSPAARAGIAPGDVLVAYDGADVRERNINVSRLLKPARRVTVTVSRDGDRRQYPLVVAPAPSRVVLRRAETNETPVPPATPAPPPRVPDFVFGGLDPARAPIAGASLENITNADLGRIFGVRTGVLVTEVYPGPAREAGLRGGDVIVRAGDRDVRSIAQLRGILESHADERAVDLQIVRQKRKQRIVLEW